MNIIIKKIRNHENLCDQNEEMVKDFPFNICVPLKNSSFQFIIKLQGKANGYGN